jgi:type IV secretion system coupling TraD/TrwB family protein
VRNEAAVLIRKEVHAIGAGLMEAALAREGCKGCSPVLCTEPVALEPLYARFDADHVLTLQPAEPPLSPAVRGRAWVTCDVYPAEDDLLSITWMETALRALGVLRGPLAFELYGEAGRVFVRFGVQADEVAGFSAALVGHFPALVLKPVEAPFPRRRPVAVNELCPVGPYHRTLSLLGKEGASPLSLAATVLAQLGEGEVGVLQVLAQPASFAHDWHYNLVNLVEAERRAVELAQLGGLSRAFSYDRELPPLLDPRASEKVGVDVAFYATLVRYAVWGTGEAQTAAFLQGMRVATGMLRFGNRAWRVLPHETLVGALGADGVARMVRERLAHRPGLMLTSREVASLMHIPNARALAMLACIAQRAGLAWQPFPSTGDAGVARLGHNVYLGESRPVEIPLPVRLRHTYVLGATGSGKSALLARLAVDDALAGVGLCLVDPHGDLCHDVLSRLPEERMGDLVLVSLAEDGLVPVWNPFRARVPSGKLADDLARAFLAQTTSGGARMEHNLRMLAYVVAELGGTLQDLAELAARSERGEALRREALETIANPQVHRFLRSELPKYAASELGSVTNKLSRLLLDDALGAMFSQHENALEPRAWMDEGRVVLVNLASGHVGADHARFVGSLLISLVYRAALSRADTPERARRPFVLYLDEFQQFQAATLAELLSEGRKYGLGAVMAHQERGQLGEGLAHALGNCAVSVFFRPAEDDVTFVHRALASRVEAADVRGLGVGEAFVACASRVARLRTELSTAPVRRDARDAGRAYARAHYQPVTSAPKVTRRRARRYQTFTDEGGA